MAAAPNGLVLEHITWWEALFEEPVRVVDGHALLPQRPGIGLALDRKTLAGIRI